MKKKNKKVIIHFDDNASYRFTEEFTSRYEKYFNAYHDELPLGAVEKLFDSFESSPSCLIRLFFHDFWHSYAKYHIDDSYLDTFNKGYEKFKRVNDAKDEKVRIKYEKEIDEINKEYEEQKELCEVKIKEIKIEVEESPNKDKALEKALNKVLDELRKKAPNKIKVLAKVHDKNKLLDKALGELQKKELTNMYYKNKYDVMRTKGNLDDYFRFFGKDFGEYFEEFILKNKDAHIIRTAKEIKSLCIKEIKKFNEKINASKMKKKSLNF